jgi:myo-inositol 2-dehydrogenase/D-chiro-inositol 1-dehydrogenase
MVMYPLRVAVIGCGRMGGEHARASALLGASVSLLCDSEVSRAEALANKYPGSAVLKGWQEIEWASIDAVFICTPPSCRGPVELAAVRAGVPFFMEKPVGVSAEQCLELYQVLKAKPVINSIGYMNRYRASVLRARNLIGSAEPIGIVCNWVCAPYRVGWWLQPSVSGGPFNEQATHFIDLCRFFMGEAVEVSALARRSNGHTGINDTVIASLRFAKGAMATVFYSCRAEDKQIGIQIFTTNTRIMLEGWDLQLVGHEKNPCQKEDVYLRQDAAFFEAIATGDQSIVRSSLEEAIHTQQVVDAIHRSLSIGGSVPVTRYE